MIYIFSSIAFIILIPIILLLPLGVRPLTKFVILLLSFCLGIVGIMAEPFLGKSKLGILVLLVMLLLTLLVDKMKKQSPRNIKLTSSRKRELLIQDQEVQGKKLIPVSFLKSDELSKEVKLETVQDSNTFVEYADDSNLDFLEERNIVEEISAEAEVAVAHETEEETDWLNEIGLHDDIENENENINQNDNETHGSLEVVHIIDEILNENSSFIKDEAEPMSEIDMMTDSIFTELDEIETKVKEIIVEKHKPAEEMNVNQEMETLDVFRFEANR